MWHGEELGEGTYTRIADEDVCTSGQSRDGYAAVIMTYLCDRKRLRLPQLSADDSMSFSLSDCAALSCRSVY